MLQYTYPNVNVNANQNANAASGSIQGPIGANTNTIELTENFDFLLQLGSKNDILHSHLYVYLHLHSNSHITYHIFGILTVCMGGSYRKW